MSESCTSSSGLNQPSTGFADPNPEVGGQMPLAERVEEGGVVH
jgi:hypothetical protein